jgi:hypothetical protein
MKAKKTFGILLTYWGQKKLIYAEKKPGHKKFHGLVPSLKIT